MILLEVDINYVEKVCKISDFFEKVVLERNWDTFITIILDGNKESIVNIIQNQFLKKICRKVNIWVSLIPETYPFAKELLQSGVKMIIFNSGFQFNQLDEIPKARKICLIEDLNDILRNNYSDIIGTYSKVILNINDTTFLEKGIQSMIFKLRSNISMPIILAFRDIYPYFSSIASNGADILIYFDFKLKLSLIDTLLVNILDFKKVNGLIPTIVQDQYNNILMLAYSSRESLTRTLETREATYYSRSRKTIWIKGEQSGNYQDVVRVYYDCDADSLIFKVKQTNFACHTGAYSCFNDSSFSFGFLYDIIIDRIRNSSKSESYTKKLVENPELLLSKIEEESLEVINYKDYENLIWEIADLMYFLLVLMASKEIFPNDILNELWRRNK